MYLGMLSPRKQPEMLARAADGLGRPDVQLVFAGNDMGAERSTRDAVRRLGLESRTRFTGLLEGPARYEALAAADVFVYPSYDEVFGLAPLEALQSGTPVVVSNDSGCGEIVGAIGGGLLVPPGDAQALAKAIETMLRRPPALARGCGACRGRSGAAFPPSGGGDRAGRGLPGRHRAAGDGMNDTGVSFIVPVHNGERWLDEALASILVPAGRPSVRDHRD